MSIVIEALCIILDQQPAKQPDGKLDYWPGARLMFSD
jgi:hypothetical protein